MSRSTDRSRSRVAVAGRVAKYKTVKRKRTVLLSIHIEHRRYSLTYAREDMPWTHTASRIPTRHNMRWNTADRRTTGRGSTHTHTFTHDTHKRQGLSRPCHCHTAMQSPHVLTVTNASTSTLHLVVLRACSWRLSPSVTPSPLQMDSASLLSPRRSVATRDLSACRVHA